MEISSSLRQKLGARDRHRLSESAGSEGFQVLLRLAGSPSRETEADLRAAGLEILFTVGPVVTGRLAHVARLEEVATLPFVEQIELPSPLFPEAAGPQTTTR